MIAGRTGLGRVCDRQALLGSLAVGGDGRVGITRVLTACAPQQGSSGSWRHLPAEEVDLRSLS